MIPNGNTSGRPAGHESEGCAIVISSVPTVYQASYALGCVLHRVLWPAVVSMHGSRRDLGTRVTDLDWPAQRAVPACLCWAHSVGV